jgi:phosphatidylglycerol lysyltransferase
LGTFNEDYICNFDCAVVRNDDHVVAFANIWQAMEGRELSIDLMRHRTGLRFGIMDFLFAQLMLWGKANGYSRFNLGMAPLSGLETHPLGPVWARIGNFTFRHGEHFYNFAGLRAYKQKFKPQWVPKYLAVTGSLALPRALLDIASLTSGGTVNIVRK